MIAFNQVRKKTGVLSRCQARKRDTITNPVRLVTVAGSLCQQSAAWIPRRGASARQLQPLLETPQALKQLGGAAHFLTKQLDQSTVTEVCLRRQPCRGRTRCGERLQGGLDDTVAPHGEAQLLQ